MNCWSCVHLYFCDAIRWWCEDEWCLSFLTNAPQFWCKYFFLVCFNSEALKTMTFWSRWRILSTQESLSKLLIFCSLILIDHTVDRALLYALAANIAPFLQSGHISPRGGSVLIRLTRCNILAIVHLCKNIPGQLAAGYYTDIFTRDVIREKYI